MEVTRVVTCRLSLLQYSTEVELASVTTEEYKGKKLLEGRALRRRMLEQIV